MGTGPAGSVFGVNLFYRGTYGTSRLSRHVAKRSSDPQQRYATGEPGKVQGRERVWIVEGSYGYRVRAVSIRGKFVSSRNLG